MAPEPCQLRAFLRRESFSLASEWRARMAAAILLFALSAGAVHAEEVALTFDDLPTLSLTSDPAYARRTTERLLHALGRERVPATGFVIAGKLDGKAGGGNMRLVRAWMTRGFELGNHTWSHESLNKTPVQTYIADVARADDALRPLLATHARRPLWFRYPYLETGRTPQDKARFEGWLAQRGYRAAPVTMENSDWMFALPYDEAVLSHDVAAAQRIRRAYLAYTGRAVEWYQKAGRELFGRPIRFVFLLHATRLNADSLDDLARLLKARGLRPVSLSRAVGDPAYRTPAGFDVDGDEELSRWSIALRKPLPWDSFPDPPAEIAADNDRLDTSP
jgi:peptidoglycan/xylan/chitin deacetylase (PgdA/CDA1 family)